MLVVKEEVVQAAGSLQVCAGPVTVVESAIHKHDWFIREQELTAVLQTDTANAFNSLNSKKILHSIKVICSEISNFVINCSRYHHVRSLEGKENQNHKKGPHKAILLQ